MIKEDGQEQLNSISEWEILNSIEFVSKDGQKRLGRSEREAKPGLEPIEEQFLAVDGCLGQNEL